MRSTAENGAITAQDPDLDQMSETGDKKATDRVIEMGARSENDLAVVTVQGRGGL
jgi:hypothetical protein